tara:strand:+ start:260 stop:1153 length:894 start_codon:yes stop_codon:yes gene_type:complete
MNNYYNISAPAKLNLNLLVGDKKVNGLHYIESDMCFLELNDKIHFRYSDKDVFFQNDDKSFMINPKKNLIISALKKFRSFTDWDRKFEIYLEKKIPIGAGLGGGSADAAATLILLRNLYNKEKSHNKISFSQIFEIGYELGSDVPACLISKDLRLKGYGKEIKRIKIPNNYFFLIINPNIELSTKTVFGLYSKFNNLKNKPKFFFLENIKIYNSLLSSATNLVPQISEILNNLQKFPSIVAYGMTGSGSTCFGIIKDLKEISDLRNYFNERFFIWYGKKTNYSVNRIHSSKMLENKF